MWLRHRLDVIRRSLKAGVAVIMISTFAGPVRAQLPKLAAGVMTTIPAEPTEAETVSGPRPLMRLASKLPEWQPNFLPESDTLIAMSKATTFRRSIWQLEFSFKPVRMLTTSNGELVWYLVYKIRNNGGHLRPAASEDETGNTVHKMENVDFPVRFYPVFVLEGHDYHRRYTDRIVPNVIRQIHKKEIRDPKVRLHSSVEIGSRPLVVSGDEIDRGIWGVAMWENVDPRTDFFSVYVAGLSNAYRWPDDSEDASKLTYKTLKLNFWRPGDTIRESEDRIRFGVPKVSDLTKQAKLLNVYGLDEPKDHLWVYQ